MLCSYEEINEGSKLFCMPLTSTIKSFNKNSENYMLISEVIYNNQKLNFIKLDYLLIKNSKDARSTGISLESKTIKLLTRKILNYKNNDEMYELLRKIISYQELLYKRNQKEEKRQKKLERDLKRRESKRFMKEI